MKTLLISAVATVALSTSAMATAITDLYSGFHVLGDSLSDDGNLFEATGIPGAPYVDGRFSNGPVWNEALLQEFEDAGLPASNGAFGGARTTGGDVPSLETQAFGLSALLSPFPGTSPLVAIWAGGNDLRDGVLSPTEVANNVTDSIDPLIAAGVTDFLVFNLPDLGQTPEQSGTPTAGFATLASGLFNDTLASNLEDLANSNGDLNILSVDIAALLDDAVNNPSAFGLTNVSDACLSNPTTCDPETWLYFDGIHPTAVGHALIEDEVRAVLTGSAGLSVVPLPASAPMLLGAIGLIGWRARRAKKAA